MENIFYSSSHYAIKMLESVLDANIHIHGKEHLLHDSPTLFVANHFTRFETFVMPYIISSHTDMQVRSLADHSIFVGYFGKFLSKAGALSTHKKDRNEVILGDLMTGRKNWMIYPEGAMIKNKNVSKNGDFLLHLENKNVRVKTGSAVLAMQAELLKQKYLKAQREGNVLKVRKMREKYYIETDERLAYKNTVVVPVNITYTPLRPGTNPLMSIGDKFVETMDERIKEELEIEGNILLSSEIHIHFDEPIDIAQYLYYAKKELECEHNVSSNITCTEVENRELVSYCRHELTNKFMDAIYKNTLINFDHIFALVLEYYQEKFINIHELKRAIFLVARDVVGLKNHSVHHSITDELYKLLTYEKDPWFESALELALKQKILIPIEDELYKIDKKRLDDTHEFHTIRIKNTFRVILNEIAMFNDVSQSVQKNLKRSSVTIKEDIFHIIFNRDKKRYKADYNKFYSVILSKSKEIGEPFVLYKAEFTTGIVISHGYKSSPSEIRVLAEYLHTLGINVYGVRLSGHGTVSEDLRDSTWEMWYDSFNRGFAAMQQVSKKLFLLGFSTGGLLAIVAAQRKLNKIDGLIVINAALELQDIRVNYLVPTLNKLNNFLSIFHADLDYVETEAEFPEFNYKRNYIKSLDQLRLLMQECQGALPHIVVPTLVIQGKDDPVVKAESAKRIINEISSTDKELKEFDFSRHVIVLGEGKEKVFQAVYNFIQRLL